MRAVGRALRGHARGGSGIGAIADTLDFVFGAPIDLFVEGIATATAQGDAVATADFANTIEWGGITEIRAADGTPVVDSAVMSDSGVDWSEPVEAPEPGSLAMAITGGTILLLQSRLRRRAEGRKKGVEIPGS